MDNKLQQARELLKLHYGFSEFRSGQKEAIENILGQKDTVVIMPTGGGKSLIYQLPALVLDGATIVVSPLIALMKDQVDFLNSIGVPATFINSSISPEEAEDRIDKVKTGFYKLLYIAPERFNNFNFVQHLKELSVNLFAIDEAHCISEWGHDFRPSYTRLNRAIELVGKPPVVALTATATPEVKEDIIKQLDLKEPEIIVTGFARPNLQFGVIRTQENQKGSIIADSIKYLDDIRGIVYTGTRAKADEITRILLEEDIKAVSYHAGMDPEDRKWVQEKFMNNNVEVVVATNAFGLGIDKKDIRFVIHHDMPGNIEAYYQEAGRAGRDGQPSFCLLLYSTKDRNLREFFIRGDNPSPDMIIEVYNTLLGYEQDKVLFTYSEISQTLSENTPEMAIGTSLKLLEKEGLISRAREKTSNAYLKILTPWSQAYDKISNRAKSQKEVLTKMQDKYSRELEQGWNANLEEVAEILGLKKESLKRAVRNLADKGIWEYYPPFQGSEINILKRVDTADLDIDFSKLKAKARQAYSKLDKMEDYVYSYDCRQKVILDYFGDENSSRCGRCDNCLNTPGPSSAEEKSSDGGKTKINTKLTQLETWELYQQGLSLPEIAETRGLTSRTVVDHICFLLKKGLLGPKEVDKMVAAVKQKKIDQAVKDLGSGKLKPLKQELPEDISYEDIKLVLAKNKLYG